MSSPGDPKTEHAGRLPRLSRESCFALALLLLWLVVYLLL